MLKILVSTPTLRVRQATALQQLYASLANNNSDIDYELITEPVGKIAAVNAFNSKKWDVLLIASDDMVPMVQGWDDIIRFNMNKYFPDTDGVLWFNDGYVGDRLNTLPCLGKKYYDRFDYVYNPAYKSLWADNEFMEVATKLGKQVYIGQCIIKHEHPGNNPAVVYDDIYKRNDKFWNEDHSTYIRRKQINFGL